MKKPLPASLLAFAAYLALGLAAVPFVFVPASAAVFPSGPR